MISSRIISVQIEANPMNITIIQVYAPTSEYSDEEIEVFYEFIEETISNTTKKDFLVILGYWNAKAGADAHITWPNYSLYIIVALAMVQQNSEVIDYWSLLKT